MKILFVDDEPLTLQYLINILDWKALGLEVLGSALNGIEALKIMEQDMPDIVITDIRMPILDGISLIESIRETNGNCKIIVLSAFSDFEYARKVFSSGISGYLVKPVDEDKLLDLVKDIIEQLQLEVMELEKKKFSQNLAAETLLWEQITKPVSEGEFNKKFERLNRNPDLSRFQLLSLTLSQKDLTRDEMLSCLMLSRGLKNKTSHYLIRSGDRSWLLLLENEIGSVEVSDIRKEIQIHLGAPSYITVSAIHRGSSRLPLAFEEVQYLNSLRYYTTDSSYVFYRERHEHEAEETIRLNEAVETYFTKIKNQDIDDLMEYISRLNEKLIEKYNSDIRGYQNFWTIFVILLRTWLNKMKNQIHLPLKLNDFDSRTFLSCENASDILNYIGNLSREILLTPASISGDAQFSPIKDVKNYIHKHFAEKLTLEDIATHFAMSKNYLCRIFKDSASCTLWDYLTMIRIEHAKEMLEKTALGAGEIALAVGYDNQGYFSSVFKKKTGMSPKKYRDHISNTALYP